MILDLKLETYNSGGDFGDVPQIPILILTL